MKNKTKRDIFWCVCYLFTYTFLYLTSIKTNWFHFSLTTLVVAFLSGSLMQFIMCELGWEDDNE